MRKAVRLIRDAMNATRTWPDHDLFEEHVEEEPRSRPRGRRRNRIAPAEVERSASGNRCRQSVSAHHFGQSVSVG
jgi:hypothetical protein